MDLTTDQKVVYDKFVKNELNGKLVLINGTPGTGKSYLIHKLTSYMNKMLIPYYLLAYTNSAAVNINGCTINKILRAGKNFVTDIENDSLNMKIFHNRNLFYILNNLKIPNEGSLNFITSATAHVGLFGESKNNNKKFVIIIDELSMVPVSLFYALLVRTKLQKCTFLLFGDSNQLQPISRFKRNVFECLKDIEEQHMITYFELKTNIRHKDDANFQRFIQNWYEDSISFDQYKELAKNITFGGTPDDFYALKFPKIVLCSTNKKAREENEKLLNSVPGELLVSKWKITKVNNFPVDENTEDVMTEKVTIEDYSEVENILEKETRLLKNVVVKKNIPVVIRLGCDNETLYNGAVHEFIDFTDDMECALLRVNNEIQTIPKSSENIVIGNFTYTISQFPFGSFLTSTIHNIQGKTIDYPTLLHIDSTFDERLPYIALSRVRTPNLLYTDLSPELVLEKWICKDEKVSSALTSIEQILSRGVNRRKQQQNVLKRKCKSCNEESVDYHITTKKTKVNVADEASGVDIVCKKCISSKVES